MPDLGCNQQPAWPHTCGWASVLVESTLGFNVYQCGLKYAVQYGPGVEQYATFNTLPDARLFVQDCFLQWCGVL